MKAWRLQLFGALLLALGATVFLIAVKCSKQAVEKPAMTSPSNPTQNADAANPALPGFSHPNAELVNALHAAVVAKGAGYKPRTEHLLADGSPKYTNRLILQSSPYLLQHAHNPVNWFPWSDEAFERARREDKPILVSIGYSTCHWCHVMEHESFEDEEIARAINENYIAIKVDREERPDIDDVYMKAVTMLTGHGGWPMNVVLTPNKQPFFGGTYFPPRDGVRGQTHGFLTILLELSNAYHKRKAEVVQHAAELSQHMEEPAASKAGAAVPNAGVIEQAVLTSFSSFDSTWGGFGQAPKFPRPVLLELLLRYYRRTGNEQALTAVTVTLDKMAAGGIYDQVGGGFHRYSTDTEWLVPHFEKMLYDNAQLVGVYLDAYQITKRESYRRIVQETLDYVVREMTAKEGGFYSATDADSLTPTGHEDEGYFFTWTPAELHALLSAEEEAAVTAYFAVTAGGNFEGRTILSTPRSEEAVAALLHITAADLRDRVNTARAKLYQARAQRPPPLLDDKILTSWNGLMLSAFARAALVLNDAKYAAVAVRAGDFLWQHLRAADGRLWRSYREGKPGPKGYLDDYSFLIQGLLDLFEVNSDPQRLEQAMQLQQVLDREFWDGAHGGYFMTSDSHERLLTREKPTYDGAEPSGNAVALMNLLRLADITGADITGRAEYRTRAEQAFTAFSDLIRRAPGGYPKALCALERYLDRPLEVFIVAPAGSNDANALLAQAASAYVPNRVFAVTSEGEPLAALARLIPALQEKQPIAGHATAYVCEQGRCDLPTSDPEVFKKQLAKITPLPTPTP